MHSDLAEKLRLTAIALGCTSRKDLCARFRLVNPHTAVDLDRLSKWMQGRAAPRDAGVYADWAQLVGTGRSAAWIRSCSPEALREEFGIALKLDTAALAPRPGGFRAAAGPGGSYACYSAAWSPYYAGRLIRGSLVLRAGRRHSLAATYNERLLGRRVRFLGEGAAGSGTAHLVLREEGSGQLLFLCLFLSPPPASALVGIIAGSTFVGPEPRPSAARLVAIRVPDTAPLETTDRYLGQGEAIERDLMALDLPAAAARAAGEAAHRLLAAPHDGPLVQTPLAAQSALAGLLDPLWLDGASPPAG